MTDQNVDGGKPSAGESKESNAPPNWDTWLGGQDEVVKGLIDGHVKGLKSALESERGGRKELERQLRDLAKSAEKGSEAEKQMNAMADQLGEAERRAAFYEMAQAAGASNLKLAYLAAIHDESFDKYGRVNFDEMKKKYPELFGSGKQPTGNAGNGMGQQPDGKRSMNDFIRKAAGRN